MGQSESDIHWRQTLLKQERLKQLELEEQGVPIGIQVLDKQAEPIGQSLPIEQLRE